MKVVKRTLCSTLICMLLMVNLAYALPNATGVSLSENYEPSILLVDGQKTSMNSEDEVARGIMLSSGLIEITNQQDGTLHISVDTYAHKVVDTIFQTVFLEVWDERTKIGCRLITGILKKPELKILNYPLIMWDLQ